MDPFLSAISVGGNYSLLIAMICCIFIFARSGISLYTKRVLFSIFWHVFLFEKVAMIFATVLAVGFLPDALLCISDIGFLAYIENLIQIAMNISTFQGLQVIYDIAVDYDEKYEIIPICRRHDRFKYAFWRRTYITLFVAASILLLVSSVCIWIKHTEIFWTVDVIARFIISYGMLALYIAISKLHNAMYRHRFFI